MNYILTVREHIPVREQQQQQQQDNNTVATTVHRSGHVLVTNIDAAQYGSIARFELFTIKLYINSILHSSEVCILFSLSYAFL